MPLYEGKDDQISIQEAIITYKMQGYIVIYSHALDDFLVLAKNHSMTIPNPEKYPVYILTEIRELEGLELDELRTVHEAKKIFDGKIIKPPKKKVRK